MKGLVYSNNFQILAEVISGLRAQLYAGKTLYSDTPVSYRGRSEGIYRFTKKWNAYARMSSKKLVDPDYFTRVSLSKSNNNSYEVTLEFFENAFPEDTVTFLLGEEYGAEVELSDMLLVFCSSKKVTSGSEVVYTNPNPN